MIFWDCAGPDGSVTLGHDKKNVFATDVFPIGPFDFPDTTPITIEVDETVKLWRYSKYNQGKKWNLMSVILV